MPCMKCGRKLEEGQVFCDTCREEMAGYPVKPGTPIQLPPQQPVQPAKSRRKKHHELKPEEEIHRLRSSMRWLLLVLIVLLLAFGLLCVILLLLLEQRNIFPL